MYCFIVRDSVPHLLIMVFVNYVFLWVVCFSFLLITRRIYINVFQYFWNLSIFPFNSVRVFFVSFGAVVLSPHKFKIVIYFN